jgi:hypothetical protein
MSRLQALATRLARIAVFVLLAVPASAPAWSALASDDHCLVARLPAQADDLVDLTGRPEPRAPAAAGRPDVARSDRAGSGTGCGSTGSRRTTNRGLRRPGPRPSGTSRERPWSRRRRRGGA